MLTLLLIHIAIDTVLWGTLVIVGWYTLRDLWRDR